MPVKIPASLPARATLESENVFVMGEERAAHQDIRPMRVAMLNLMPTKIATETQILRLIGNSALQVDVTLLRTTTHEPRNTGADHLLKHYCSFDEIRSERFDGLIITGAPIEHLRAGGDGDDGQEADDPHPPRDPGRRRRDERGTKGEHRRGDQTTVSAVAEQCRAAHGDHTDERAPPTFA